MSIREDVKRMKQSAPYLAAAGDEERCKALRNVALELEKRKEEIFSENEKDMLSAEENNIPEAVKKRLKFNESKLQDVLSGIETLIRLSDPTGKITLFRELDEGLMLKRITCPIGVIGVIFEARPDALVQIATLCIKSGNCAILKGGRETSNTNRILFQVIKNSVVEAGLPEDCMLLAESHSEIDELLSCYGDVDLIIPRGSNAFVRYIMDNTKIPVMGHADGICHIYVDKDADIEKSISVIKDAKLQYTAACNAVETILVHADIADSFLPKLVDNMNENGVVLKGDSEVKKIADVEELDEDGYKEYLDTIASVKIVKDLTEAINHINRYGSHHTDCIMTCNDKTADTFMQLVDSAGVYRNCSTRFADGFRYGFGAEVGISTGKLHARGPVGLEGLVTYKYLLVGDGHIVSDYADGNKTFNFRDRELGEDDR